MPYKMDVFKITALLFGILKYISGQNYPDIMPKCIECTHIMANRSQATTNRNLYNFFELLDNKFNIACDCENPESNEEREWRETLLRERNVYIPPSAGNQVLNPVIKVPCQAMNPNNRCNFIRGTVGLLLPHYNNAKVYIEMTVRNCELKLNVENICYLRNSNLGNQDLLNFFEIRLSFLGRNTYKVVSFHGRQCYCRTNLCKPLISGSERTSGYLAGLVFAALVALLF